MRCFNFLLDKHKNKQNFLAKPLGKTLLVSAINTNRASLRFSLLCCGFGMEEKAVAMKLITQTMWMFALFCSCIAHAKEICPPKELFEPCTCSSNTYLKRAYIRCTNITRMETLVDVFRRSGDRHLDYFTLDFPSLMYLPASSLETKRFKGLAISNGTLDSLFDSVPSVSNNLEYMLLYNISLLRGLRWDQFENLSKLTELQITNTEVKRLGKSFSKNVPKTMVILEFYRTKMSHIDDRAFESLSRLRYLVFDHNKIKTLKRSMFSRPVAIKHFSFGYNEIESLPEDMFSDMPSLTDIVLKNNKISKFTESIFGGTYLSQEWSYLELENNPINCDCSFSWFTTKSRKTDVLGTCAEPVDKKGRSMKDITKEDMDYCHESQPREFNSIEAIFRS